MQTAEIGYTLSEAFQGRGIATRAVGLMIDRVFTETPLRKITAYVHDRNLPSLRLLGRLGFGKKAS